MDPLLLNHLSYHWKICCDVGNPISLVYARNRMETLEIKLILSTSKNINKKILQLWTKKSIKIHLYTQKNMWILNLKIQKHYDVHFELWKHDAYEYCLYI
jgi:hypothetical protein